MKRMVLPPPEYVLPLLSTSEISRALLHILYDELKTENGHIDLLLQPDHDFFINLLSANDFHHFSGKIRHILCLNNGDSSTHSNYNLYCLEKILPLYGTISDYNCYYYYDNIDSKIGSVTLFPYMILTSRYTCLMTSDFSRGYLTNDPATLRMLSDIYENYLAHLSLLFSPFTTDGKQFEYNLNLIQNSSEGYSFQMSPCLTPHLTPELLDKYVIKEIPDRQEFLSTIKNYVQHTFENSTPAIHRICSIDGIRKFLETGTLSEYPPEIYTPIDLPDRIQLLSGLLRDVNNGFLKILKQNIGSLENEIFLYISKSQGYLAFQHTADAPLIYLNIEEPGLIYAFWDFCASLTSDLFFTSAEAETELKNLLK